MSVADPVDLSLPARVHDVRAADLDALAAAATALSRWLIAAPDQPTLDHVRDADVLAGWPLPLPGAEDAGDTAAGLALLAESAVVGEDTRQVRADHSRLFVGPGRLPAPPYESVHRSQERLLFDEQTLAVRGWYKHYGLSAPRQGREPDDHLGLELEFLAQLLVWALEALDDGDATAAATFTQAAGRFWAEHPQQWASTLFCLVDEHAATAFYRGLARLGLGLMAAAAAVLPEPA